MNDTPIEKYEVNRIEVLVKREDLACPLPGPRFSKVRGLFPHVQKLKSQGIETIGYTETSVSQAGWGVAWACKEIGLKCIIFKPVYSCRREDLKLLAHHEKQWKKFGAEIIPIKAGRAKVNYYSCRKWLKENNKAAVMLPLGLPLQETIWATAEVAKQTEGVVDFNSVVVNVGSGTICCGIINGLSRTKKIYGIMGRTGNINLKRKQMLGKTQKFGYQNNFCLIDPGWQYTERSKVDCPFPTHPYYDLKAWQWLVENLDKFGSDKVLFWNIGS